MNQYKYKPSSFEAIKRKSLLVTIPSLVVIFFITSFNLGAGSTILYLMILVSGAIAFGTYRSLKRQKRMFESFAITVDDIGVQRNQLDTQTIRISREQIKKILKSPNGSLEIVGSGRGDVIVVPWMIEGRDELEKLLSAIHVITPQENITRAKWLPWLVFLSTIILIGTFFRSSNRTLGIVTGTLLVFELTWAFYVVRSSKQIDNKTKRVSWWLIVVILSFAAMVYAKIVNG